MPQPPSSQKPIKRTTAKLSSTNHPCLTLLCCPCGCAKVSRSNIFTHTQSRDSSLLPRYRMPAAPLCTEAATGALQDGTHCPEPHHHPPPPPKSHLGTGHLGTAVTLKKTRGKEDPIPCWDAPVLATATHAAQELSPCSQCCQQLSSSCFSCLHTRILARTLTSPPSFASNSGAEESSALHTHHSPLPPQDPAREISKMKSLQPRCSHTHQTHGGDTAPL